MQLETYISDLLYRYECVTIPEFGAFITQNTSASIDEASNTFYAPKKTVSFNEQIKKNDGLLAHYIADVEKIPFETANKKITKQVKLLKSFLTQGETLTFKNIGEIKFNQEGKILFEPSDNLNYLTDSFGLTQLVSPSINREVYKENVEAIEKTVPIMITPEKRKATPYLRYAAVALIALTLGGSVASNYYVKKIEEHNQLARVEATKQLDTKIQEATFNLNALPAITLNIAKQSGNYHLIAGAFRVKENSEKKVNELKELGFDARILGMNKFGLYEVVYSSYETGEEAVKAVRSIRENYSPDVWIKIDSEKKDVTPEVTVVSVPDPAPKSEPTQKPESTQKIVLQPVKETPVSKPVMDSKNESTIKPKKEKVTANIEGPSEKLEETTNEPITPEPTPASFPVAENNNIIEIIRGVSDVENAFYIILNTFTDTKERDAFIKELSASGVQNPKYFFHIESAKYFVYSVKFNTLQAAQKLIDTEVYSTLPGKHRIVRIQN